MTSSLSRPEDRYCGDKIKIHLQRRVARRLPMMTCRAKDTVRTTARMCGDERLITERT